MPFFRRYLVPIGILTLAWWLYTMSLMHLVAGIAAVVIVHALVQRHTAESLCDTCAYNSAEHCRRPERGFAKVCAGYERGRPPRPPRGEVLQFPQGGQRPH